MKISHANSHRSLAVLRTSKSPEGKDFVDFLPNRTVDGGAVLICGETNIIKLKRKPEPGFSDPYGALPVLSSMGPVILNPIHDYMTRYEMRKKRQHYSRGGKWVLSVWNKGKRKGETRLPWTAYHDGVDETANIRKLENAVPARPDIMIGVATLLTVTIFSGSRSLSGDRRYRS